MGKSNEVKIGNIDRSWYFVKGSNAKCRICYNEIKRNTHAVSLCGFLFHLSCLVQTKESFCSCSHGAGRKMSRGAAKSKYTKEDLKRLTEGVECRKDNGVIDEIPAAYKNIDQVMENQKDLVEPIAVLKQIMCIKG